MDHEQQGIKMIESYESLTEPQKEQFKRIVMEGLKGKFIKALQNDTASMQAIVNIGIKYNFLPMSKSYCAVDSQTGDVLAILVLNDFIKPSLKDLVLTLTSAIRTIGLLKAIRIASSFIAIDNMNKEENPEGIKAEIYLVSTNESHRGKGIGTILMQNVLDRLHQEFEADLNMKADCRVKLLVFGANPAIRLYERLGFNQVSAVATPQMAKTFGPSYDVLIRMERAI